MATRPIFIPDPEASPFVIEIASDFEWYPGFSKTQAQKSIQSLHASAANQGISPILEISSKSPETLGVALSAFNLHLEVSPGKIVSVESAFQGSKVFENDGPFTDLYDKPGREAKRDPRLRSSGDVRAFNLLGELFPLEPITGFYDWLYLRALLGNRELANQLPHYEGFSDIAFNPERSVNCQARSAALFVALSKKSTVDLDRVVRDKQYFLTLMTGNDADEPKQLPLSWK